MSREIDPDNLTDDDVQYLVQRPFIRDEMVRQGYPDPFENLEVDEDPMEARVVSTETTTEGTDGGDEAPDDYDSWKKAELLAEVEKRNEERDEENKVVVNGTTKESLVYALRADDQGAFEDDDNPVSGENVAS